MTARRGIQWQPAIETVRGSCPQARVWRRQMVLGPAAEFAVETPAEAEIDVPAGWQPGYICPERTTLITKMMFCNVTRVTS